MASKRSEPAANPVLSSLGTSENLGRDLSE